MSGRYLLSKGGSAAYRDDIASALERPTMRPVVVIDPEDREQVKRLRSALIAQDMLDTGWDEGPSVRRVTDALRSLIAPPKCAAILNVKGEHVDCDRGEGHSLPHGNVEHGAIWQGVTS